MRDTIDTSAMSNALHDIGRIMVAVGIFCLLLVAISWKSRGATKQAQAYTQVLTCIGSIPVSEKTAPNIEKCWRIVENDTGLRLNRYSDRINFSQQ